MKRTELDRILGGLRYEDVILIPYFILLEKGMITEEEIYQKVKEIKEEEE